MNSRVRKCVVLLASCLVSAADLSAQNTAILKQNGTPPSGSSASMIHQAGNFVGLGTTAPSGPLEVRDQSVAYGSDNVANIVISQDGGNLSSSCYGTLNNPPSLKCLPDYSLVLRSMQYNTWGLPTGYSNRFVVTRDGYIGIRQTPHIGSAITAKGGWLDMERTGAGSSLAVGLRFRDASSTINHSIGTDANNQLTITPGVGGTASDAVKIVGGLEASKKVLIHTGWNLNDALEVHGKSMLDGPVNALHDLSVGGHTSLANALTMGGTLTVGQSVTVAQTITVDGDGSLKGTIKTGPLHVGYDFNTPNNTPFPGGYYHLIVWGDALVKRVKVAVPNTTAWADYVFADKYKLRPLTEVSNYIRQNGHLPDVPSAEEVVKEGVDLQTMDATLLRKVEELTLYVLAQQKEIDELKNELRGRKK